MTNKKTLVLGASEKPERYSYKAIHMLRKYNMDVEAIGNRAGKVADVTFDKQPKPFVGIHTVTLYLGPSNQTPYYDYILSLNPKRLIFNPGTENDILWDIARQQGIECMEACTLVLLSTGQY
jgi:predicted CoA-binding protein